MHPHILISIANLTVGKELLIGRTVNTNAHWIGGQLYKMGRQLDRVLVVTDSVDEISDGLNELLELKPDFLLVVGGLGPTPDDMTLKGVAKGLGLKLVLNRDALDLIKEHYERTGRGSIEITPVRRKMAIFPQGAKPLANNIGTAPGVRIKKGGTVIFCLPGVPKEMKDIFKRSIEKEIRQKIGKLYTSKVTMKLVGIYESSLAPFIEEALEKYPGAYIKSHPKGVREGQSRIELDILSTANDPETASGVVSRLSSYFTKKVADLGGKISGRSENKI